jgi:hypothetical protein
MKDLFRGELVRITFEEPDAQAKAEVRWQRDSEFVRLADSDPIQLIFRKEDQRSVRRSALKTDSHPNDIPFPCVRWLKTS